MSKNQLHEYRLENLHRKLEEDKSQGEQNVIRWTKKATTEVAEKIRKQEARV